MSLDQEAELIRRFPIFQKLEKSMLKLLCFSSERLTYQANQVIFDAGDEGNAAYVIIEGRAEVTVPTSAGPIVLTTLGPNDLLGEIAIFADAPRTATVTTTTPLVALRISKEHFMGVIRQNPDAAMELIRVLATRLARTTAKLSEVERPPHH